MQDTTLSSLLAGDRMVRLMKLLQWIKQLYCWWIG
jgi:hypothetical protein